MKKLIAILFLFQCANLFAQESEKGKFDASRLFTGGSVNFGFSSNGVTVGASPQLGYSVASWADLGVVFNINYNSRRDVYADGDQVRQTTYGPAVFTRLFPVKFLFASAQFEYNTTKLKYHPAYGNYYNTDTTFGGPSLLLGVGYAGGRQPGSNSYYYMSVSWDVMGDENSPYINEYGKSIPIFRVGYNIGLFQNRNRKL